MGSDFTAGGSELSNVCDLNTGAGPLVQINSCAGGSPQELDPPTGRWCWGGGGPLQGIVRCTVYYTDCRQENAGCFEGGKQPSF